MKFSKFSEESIKFLQETSISNKVISALGLNGELGELIGAILNNDKDNIIEEMGDFLWYLSLLCDEFDIIEDVEYNKNNISVLDVDFLVLFLEVSKISELVKKNEINEKEIHINDLFSSVSIIYQSMKKICDELEIDIELIYKKNIEKLSERNMKNKKEYGYNLNVFN